MGALVNHWSTAAVDERQRLAYWMDSICESFLEMKAKPADREGFFGSIRQSSLRNVVVNESIGSPQNIDRDRRAIARGRENHFYLITQIGSPWFVAHAGREHMVQAGDTVLVDSSEPYVFGFPGGLHHLSLELPYDWVARWLPNPSAALGRPVDGSHGWGAVLRAFKIALTPEFAAEPELPSQLLEDQLGVLLSLSFGRQTEATRKSRSAYLRCVAAMRERFMESNVLAQDIALKCAISVRGLHRVFAHEGRTFAGVLLEMRMQEAERLLGDRRFKRLTVANIALRCGFADASHFSRQFRRYRQCTPRVFRMLRGTA